MNKDACLVIGGMLPAKTSRVRGAMQTQTRVRRRRRRVGPGSRRLPSRATPVFHYLGA
jgi:hypothetical protein